MSKYLTGILLAALLAACGWGWLASQRAEKATEKAILYEGRYYTEKAAREAVISQAKLDEKLLLARVAKAESRTVTIKKVDREIKDAVKASPEWAGTPVPVGVRNALASAGLVPKGEPSKPAPPTLP